MQAFYGLLPGMMVHARLSMKSTFQASPIYGEFEASRVYSTIDLHKIMFLGNKHSG